MQSFGTLLSDNKGLAVVLAILIVVVLVAAALFLYRLVFGRRLHMTGGRSRQPRLGVIDAFDLDRQRQLILIRRDNVEHLLMIGGPNDLVIESAFIRAQSSVAVPTGRDKEASGPGAPVIPMASALEAPAAATQPVDSRVTTAFEAPLPSRPVPAPAPERPVLPQDLGALSDIPAPQPVRAPQPTAIRDVAPPAPLPRVQPPQPPVTAASLEPLFAPIESDASAEPQPSAPGRPLLSRLGQGLPARTSGNVLPPRQPLSSPRPPIAPSAGSTGTLPRPPVQLSNRPAPSAPLQRGTSAASLRGDPPGSPPFLMPERTAGGTPSAPEIQPSAERSEPDAAAPSPRVPPEPGSAQGTPAMGSAVSVRPMSEPSRGLPLTLDSIESLEEEMAKLLGRAAASNDKK